MRLIKLILILCLTINSIAQTKKAIPFSDFKEEYKNLIAQQPVQNYSVGINLFYYDSKERKQTIQMQVSELKVLEGNRYIYNSGANIQIQEGDIRLDIDTILKRILVSKSKLQPFDIASNSTFENIDSLNYRITKSVMKDKLIYEISEDKQSTNYQTISFIFDMKTKNFLGLELLLWPSNYSSEKLDDESTEQPFIVYTYSTFKKIKEAELKKEELLSTWFTTTDTGTLVSTKLEYKLHDLR
jgi:uncharacterized protein (UPF0262 family)